MGRTLGFVGLGNMGEHMARRLLERNHTVALYDIRSEALEQFRNFEKALILVSPAEVAECADTVMVCLPSPFVVKEVALGAGGLIHGNRFNTYIDFSTTGPQVAEEVAVKLTEKGVAALDAPVSGGVRGAREGTLSIMVSGSKEKYDEVLPILEVFGTKLFYIGPRAGQAQAMKLVNNYLSAVALTASSEAMVVGVKAGLQPRTMIDVLNASSGRNSATMDKIPRSVLTRKFDFGFKTGLAHKDINLFLEVAETLGVKMWLGQNLKEIWDRTNEEFGQDSDMTEIVRMFENWNGVQIEQTD